MAQSKLSDLIAPHLPMLRRYARALCGTQEHGDLYVRIVLEALIADPDMLRQSTDESTDPKIQLFKVFHSIWRVADTVENNVFNITLPQELSAQAHLQKLTPPARQALLLVSMEGFSASDVAIILDIDFNEVANLLQSAREELDRQIRTDVLVIEDEPIIALDIERIVRSLGHNVTGNSTTHTEAVAMVKEKRPGLILADIQLADGSSGIEAVNEILKDIDVPIIFITAFPERLLTGDRPEPAFLISKPFMPEAVEIAISQALVFNRPKQVETLAS